MEYPFISVEEEDEPKSSTSEVFKAVTDSDQEYLEFLIKVRDAFKMKIKTF